MHDERNRYPPTQRFARIIVAVKVLVTGGTGFLGSHAVAAMAGAGHDLRLLVRRSEQVGASLGPFGVEVADIVVGDWSAPRFPDGWICVISCCGLLV
jgi:nucleoside-diphosphate-sugar epimerase